MYYTLKYRLRDSNKNKRLDETINLAGRAYNHVIALHKRWFRLFGKKNLEANIAFEKTYGRKPDKKKGEVRTTYIPVFTMNDHLKYLKDTKAFAWLKKIPSQALQNVAERVDEGYQRFFDAKKDNSRRKISPPSFKRVRNYRSFTLKKTSGWKVLGKGKVRLNKANYRFFESRPITGEIKTVTVLRNALGHYYVCFACETEEIQSEIRAATGQTAGLDFGLKTSWTIAIEDTAGKISVKKITVPRAMLDMLPKLRKADRKLSKAQLAHDKRVEAALDEWKRNGCNGPKPYIPPSKRLIKARLERARIYNRIANIRSDWQWKLAREWACENDIVYAEDVYFAGMAKRKKRRRWGRKLLDLAPASLLEKLEHECHKHGTMFIKRDWNYPSTQTCHACGHRLTGDNKLKLEDREWTCPVCGTHHDRDENAAINILKGTAATETELSVA